LKKEKPEKTQRTWLRLVPWVLLIGLIAFIGIDGYFNEWRTPKRIWYWNTLELRGTSDTLWRLKANKDFTLIEIKDVRTIAIPESLSVFDKMYCDSGYYRLYFRYSDTASVQLQKMYQTLKTVDTANTFQKSINDAKKVYSNLQSLLGKPSPPSQDSISKNTQDTTIKFNQSNVGMQTNDEAMTAVKKILSSPPILVGVGLGVAISMGIDLLRGNAYCAVSKMDVFLVDSLQLGVRTGKWEGLPIDILWAFKQKKIIDSVQVNATADSTSRTVDSVKTKK
jgi:hypothetical protein